MDQLCERLARVVPAVTGVELLQESQHAARAGCRQTVQLTLQSAAQLSAAGLLVCARRHLLRAQSWRDVAAGVGGGCGGGGSGRS